jgi:hypothetical protein
MTHDETKAGIEADIAEERSALAQSISQLSEQFSAEKLVGSVGETIKTQSDDLAQAVVRGAKENPAAIALIGAGMAWLLLSRNGSSSERSSTVRRTPVAYDARPTAPVAGFGNGTANQEEAAFKARVARAEAALREPHEADDPSFVDRSKQYVRRTAAQMRATLYDGTQQLGDMARARVVDARRKAIVAQERVEHHSRKARGKGAGFYQENPLLVGGAVALVGAAAALALPRTRFEDETFGQHRDALIDEADRTLHEEMDRARRMAGAAMDEAGEIAREKLDQVPSGEEAVSRTEAELRSAGERIADRAQEAKRH